MKKPAGDLLLHPLDPLAARVGDAGQRAGLVGGCVRRLLGADRRPAGAAWPAGRCRRHVSGIPSCLLLSRQQALERLPGGFAAPCLCRPAPRRARPATRRSSSGSFFRTIPPESASRCVCDAPAVVPQLEPAIAGIERDPAHRLGPEHPARGAAPPWTRPGTASSSLAARLSTNAVRSLVSARSDAASRSMSIDWASLSSDDTALRLLDVFRAVTAGKPLPMTTQTDIGPVRGPERRKSYAPARVRRLPGAGRGDRRGGQPRPAHRLPVDRHGSRLRQRGWRP